MKTNTVRSGISVLVGSMLLPTTLAFAQTPDPARSPIYLWLNTLEIARSPFSGQSDLVPGSLISGGSTHIGSTRQSLIYTPSEISGEAVSLSNAAMQNPKVNVSPDFDLSSKLVVGGSLAIASWVPGVDVTTQNKLAGNSAQFVVTKMRVTDAMRLGNSQGVKDVYALSHRTPTAPGLGDNLYLVYEVYYTKQVHVTASNAQYVTFSSGSKLPQCSDVEEKTDKSADAKTADTKDKGSIDQTIKKVTSSVTSLTATAAGTPIQISGKSCRNSDGSENLVSETPLAVGVKVLSVGYPLLNRYCSTDGRGPRPCNYGQWTVAQPAGTEQTVFNQ